MSMYDDYTFIVNAVHPSAHLTYQSHHASTSRKFKTPCQNAEEFALRQLGKFYDQTDTDTPRLPAPYPFTEGGATDYGQMALVATGFSIEPVSGACFNTSWGTPTKNNIDTPTSINQLERYWYENPDSDDPADECCECIATITYEENPCDCMTYDGETGLWSVHEFILPNTCASVERNPSYEMFTLPNGNLIWSDLPANTNRQLKQDSFAYKVIPKADIIVSWHNVPVNKMCQIESHLRSFRGCVNNAIWGAQLSCDHVSEGSGVAGCSYYEPETILFIDYQEDRQFHTDAFGGMRQDGPASNRNTTTLKLMFKQKRIVVPANTSDSDTTNDTEEIVGWNHLFMDREVGVDSWMRVQVESTGEDLFPTASFNTIMYPLI